MALHTDSACAEMDKDLRRVKDYLAVYMHAFLYLDVPTTGVPIYGSLNTGVPIYGRSFI